MCVCLCVYTRRKGNCVGENVTLIKKDDLKVRQSR